jgi:hypothetical protein
VNEVDLSNLTRDATRHFKNNKREYLKDRINKLQSNLTNNNTGELYNGIKEFKKGYQPTVNLVKNQRGDQII